MPDLPDALERVPHPRARAFASGWTRVLVGPLRGMTFREWAGGRAWARGAAEQIEADRQLRAQGVVLINPPRGHQCTES